METSTRAVLAGAALLVAVSTAAYVAVGQDTKAPSPPATTGTAPAPAPAAAKPPAGAGLAPAESSKPEAWIGLPVIAADGATVGQVAELKPSADGKSTVLIVKAADNKTIRVPSSIATMQGRAVQVSATAAELSKMD